MKKTAPAAVIVAASMWGIDSIVLRPSLYTLPVSLVVLIEAGLATLLLTPFFIRDLKILRKFGVRDWLAFLGMAILGGAIGTMAITKALFYVNYINLSIVVLIQKLQPVFALIAAALILKERPPRIFFLWSAIATTGAYIMTFGMAKPNWDAADMIVQAAVYATLAALSFALSTIFSKMALQNVNFGAVTYLRFVFMVGVMLLTVLGSGTYDMIGQITGQQILILLIIALTTGITASFLYFYGLKNISASLATICELSFPLTAVILEYLIHDNILRIEQWSGVFILFYAIMRITRLNEHVPQSVPPVS